jgi:DNA-binding NtrC family response regulator
MSKSLVVITEGDNVVHRSFTATLGRSRHEVATTIDPLKVLHHAECQTPGILILNLPGDTSATALDVARAIRRKTAAVPVILIPGGSTEGLAIAALRAGVTDYLKPPVTTEELLESIRRCFDGHTCHSPTTASASRPAIPDPPQMVGKSRTIQSILLSIANVAATDSTVLITGETGTGKELAIELIHYYSARRAKPLVRINCAAIPDTLLESELFGYERGAFTGAHIAFDGKLKCADGGTVFFDEIGDMTPYAQAKLLRVIETREADRLGGTKSVALNIRIAAATNLDLEPLLTQGKFRKDLYFRLNVVRIHLPPLRERRQDIPSLVDHYINVLNTRMGTRASGITAAALESLVRYDWPGNVRELKNVVEATLVGHPSGTITPARLPAYLRQSVEAPLAAVENDGDSTERDRVLSALFDTNWNKCKAAKQLHWSRMTLYRKMAKHHIVPA